MFPKRRQFLGIGSKFKWFPHICLLFFLLFGEKMVLDTIFAGVVFLGIIDGETFLTILTDRSRYMNLTETFKQTLEKNVILLLLWSSSMDIWVSHRDVDFSLMESTQASCTWILHILIYRMRRAKGEPGKFSSLTIVQPFLSLWNWSYSFKIKKRNIIIWKFVK